MKKTRLFFAVSSFIAASPIISVLLASMVASLAGCDLDEGSAHTCVIMGADWSDLLYAMFVMGWLGLVTLPFLGLLVPAWIITEVVHFVKKRRSES